MQFCDQCGTAFVENARFCTACGAPRREPASSASIPPAAALSAPMPAPVSASPAAWPAGGGVPASPGAGSPATAPRPQAGITAGLVAAGLVVGSLVLGFGVDLLPEDFWYDVVYSNPVTRILWPWFLRLLPWALAGGAAALHLRPSRNRILAAATLLGGPTLLVAILGSDATGFLLGRWYRDDLVPSSPTAAAGALAGWLVLRGRSGPRLLLALIPLVAGLLLTAGHAPFPFVLSVVTVVGVAWLAAIGTGPRPSATAAPAAATVAGPAFQVLYTEQGERVLLPAAPAPTKTNGAAIASLVLGLAGGWITLGLPAIITGHVARRQIRERGESGDGLAITGLVFGYLTLAFDLFIALLLVANS